MSNNEYKKYTTTWKQFINENKSSNISEGPFGAAAQKFGSAVSRAFGGKKAPTGKGISSYPVWDRMAAAQLMSKGTTIPTTTKDKEAATARTDLELSLDTKSYNQGGLASFGLTSNLYMIADGERCELATANWEEHGESTLWVVTPIWTLDTGDVLPGHDNPIRFFFDDQGQYEAFLRLLKEAISDTKGTKGIIGECVVRMVHPDILEPKVGSGKERAELDNTFLIPRDDIKRTREKIIVGTMNIVWNNDFFPAVVVSFGDIEKPYIEYPYFFSMDGAKELLKVMESTGGKAVGRTGSIYKPMLGGDMVIPIVPYVFSTICKIKTPSKSERFASTHDARQAAGFQKSSPEDPGFELQRKTRPAGAGRQKWPTGL